MQEGNSVSQPRPSAQSRSSPGSGETQMAHEHLVYLGNPVPRRRVSEYASAEQAKCCRHCTVPGQNRSRHSDAKGKQARFWLPVVLPTKYGRAIVQVPGCMAGDAAWRSNATIALLSRGQLVLARPTATLMKTGRGTDRPTAGLEPDPRPAWVPVLLTPISKDLVRHGLGLTSAHRSCAGGGEEDEACV